MVLGQCERGKGDAKENADDRGSNETEQEEIEYGADGGAPIAARHLRGHVVGRLQGPAGRPPPDRCRRSQGSDRWEMRKKSGLNCSPLLIFTGRIRYARPVSLRKMVTLWPFGVVQ